MPATHLRWNLYGAGLENLGRDGKPERLPTPQPAPNEILVRIDAVGICFSDLKILRLGEAHPKIARDLRKHPVVMGHEICCTVVQVGNALQGRFQIGERYIVQADVYVNGRVQAVGYALDGGYSQYTVFGEPVLNGDAGCYLLRCPDHLSDAEAALVEPWACVVASYRIQPRPTPLPNGRWLVILPHAPMVRYRCGGVDGLHAGNSPHLTSPVDGGGTPSPRAGRVGVGGTAVLFTDSRGNLLAEAFEQAAHALGMATHRIEAPADALYDPAQVHTLRDAYAPDGFTDILIFGEPTPEVLEAAQDALIYGGALSFTCHHKMPPVPVDVGRLHYDRLLLMGTSSWDITDAYRHTRDTALRKGDRLLLFGAGGAMGQMQLFYALTRPEPPAQVVVVDRHPERLEPLREMGVPLAQHAGIELQFYCNADADPDAQQAHLRALCPHGYDHIMLLASSAEAVALTYPLLTDGGVLNLFAGIPKGQKVPLDLTPLASRHMRLLGSSGSTMDDIAECLRLVAEGALPARKVIGAIAGLNALPEALQAVQSHRYPGKVVVFPQLPDLPLIGLTELHERQPEVAAHLEAGRYWTRDAERALYRVCSNVGYSSISRWYLPIQ
ncbi:MAG: alcohol dehydrogenase catalytic domain-containing protein [Armatimonadetes bacterium]|nr:alcohol dehydrogenase catalytic domain-containing protein [Armatimonadota bacterium]